VSDISDWIEKLRFSDDRFFSVLFSDVSQGEASRVQRHWELTHFGSTSLGESLDGSDVTDATSVPLCFCPKHWLLISWEMYLMPFVGRLLEEASAVVLCIHCILPMHCKGLLCHFQSVLCLICIISFRVFICLL